MENLMLLILGLFISAIGFVNIKGNISCGSFCWKLMKKRRSNDLWLSL